MKNRFIRYFSLNKTEYNGIFVLVVLIFLGFIFSEIYLYQSTESLPQVEKWTSYSQPKDTQHKIYNKSNIHKNTIKSVRLYNFNPNTSNISTWMDFGLSEKQAQSIVNYVKKGGKFRKKEDLKRMFVISDDFYRKLAPFIQLEMDVKQPEKSVYHLNTVQKSSNPTVYLELNTADTAQLKLLRGIGSVFALRIVKFRNRMGGFYTVDQLKEVYGMRDSLFQAVRPFLSVDVSKIEKTAVNIAEFKDLRRYSFLSSKQINAIIQYRTQHGKYQSVKDLENILILTPEIIQKLEPYLSYD